jgi:hypothetical protein
MRKIILDEYDKFMMDYRRDHKYCPQCGSEKYVVTLVDYILDFNKKEEYKDLNKCVCQECNDVHIMHERVKRKEK